ncbi:hypothetical protein [Streptomyces sp. NPDC093261]|uniref:hypothetical protein n=1 Tax=Streptomyces sp. NPDC093261 TaxID=3366037 RepID=UPI0038250279
MGLAKAVVELCEADGAAADELWPADIDPAVLAATEQRAYPLLGRLHHPGYRAPPPSPAAAPDPGRSQETA